MGKTKSDNSILGWILAYIAIAVFLYLVLHQSIFTDANALDWISAYGVYTTLFSLVLMFVQFKSIRKVSEETKNKLNKTVAISDLSKHSELIRSVETDVINNNIKVALYKTQNIKASVYKIKVSEKDPDYDKEEYESVFSILATHIDSYNEQLLTQEPILNQKVILKDLETVTSFFQKKSIEMINNIE